MSSVKHKSVEKETDEIDLGRIVGEIIDNRKLIISIVSLFTLLAIVYALFATPVYQADALVQVEEKQANAILSNLSQMLPDSQPQSAPEIALLQSRMILGKTVDDLNLQAEVRQKYFPVFGSGWARLMGDKPGEIYVSRLYISMANEDIPELTLKVIDHTNYTISGDGFELSGKTGVLLDSKGLSIKIDKIDANPGTEFTITYLTRLQAITELQKILTVTDQGKDTGILSISLTGENKKLIENIVDSIIGNYLAQNISRQAAQDSKSLEFLSLQLPKVRSELDLAEDKLNAYRRQNDSVDLSLEAKSVLDQIVNADNQLNELTFRESEISQLYTKEHPTYKALMEKRKTLQDEKLKLNKKVSSMPETQQEILRLSRDVESGRAVYMQLLNRQQELNIAKSSAIGNVRIIDEAVTQPKPVKPKKILVVLAGLILGGIISLGLVMIRMFLRRGIETPEQLEDLGINVYASIPKDKMVVINNGVNIPEVTNQVNCNNCEEYVLLYVGRFDYQKGTDVFIDALKIIDKTALDYKIKVIMIGEPVNDSVDYKNQKFKNINLIFTGWINQELLFEYYLKANCLVIPSRWEGLAMVPLEAISYKLPVIASNISAFQTINSLSGLSFSNEDPASLAKLLSSLNDFDLNKIKDTLYDKVSTEYTQELMNEKTIVAYKNLIA
ncbi:Uncharacterized protein involved in exopolysaccharide biosynthesis [Klebsiella quasipneumoniae]|nr:GNVR domain-containing protein [Klebsiella quasipneumoniae]SDB43414.1 Uncharacterized protein involved in exopolysaccharide biosynthesis [Klebsiella quasipneumoniae]